MKYYNPNYDRYLKQYGFGSWLKNNAMAIGTVAGTIGGSFIGMPQLGTTIGGAVGGAVQQDAEQDQQAQQMQDQLAQQQYQNKVNIAKQKLGNTGLQQQQFAGTNRFEEGGALLGPNPESLFAFHLYDPATGRRGINRALTQNTQDLIRKNPGATDLEDAGIQSTFRGGTRNFYGTRDNGEIGYITSTLPFDGTEMNDYRKHLDAMRSLYERTNIYNLLPKKEEKTLKLKEFGGDLLPKQSISNSTGISSYPLRNLKYAMGGGLINYTGQDHNGPSGGIEVDQNGSPTATTGKEPVGLTESGEKAWKDPNSGQTYIFSKKLSYTK